MNLYVGLINDTIEYIEENIGEPLSLEEIASKFSVSEFHFNRIFKTVVGRTLKQYILGRKLTQALEHLNASDRSVIDTALDFGFEYPEVFSRAFKKQFGISPSGSRYEKIEQGLVKRAKVVERDIVNYQGVLTLKGSLEYLSTLQLEGLYTEVDENSSKFESVLKAKGEEFFKKSEKAGWLKKERFYTVVNCHGEEEDGKYTVFYGMEAEAVKHEACFGTRLVPEGWYARFIYSGDMFDIRETFVDDLYRWVMLKEIELKPNGVGMLNIYEKDYAVAGNVQIFVPVKSNKQQEMS